MPEFINNIATFPVYKPNTLHSNREQVALAHAKRNSALEGLHSRDRKNNMLRYRDFEKVKNTFKNLVMEQGNRINIAETISTAVSNSFPIAHQLAYENSYIYLEKGDRQIERIEIETNCQKYLEQRLLEDLSVQPYLLLDGLRDKRDLLSLDSQKFLKDTGEIFHKAHEYNLRHDATIDKWIDGKRLNARQNRVINKLDDISDGVEMLKKADNIESYLNAGYSLTHAMAQNTGRGFLVSSQVRKDNHLHHHQRRAIMPTPIEKMSPTGLDQELS